ncbi:conserved exported hypothetical protein [uncultured Dysgonomonas sp.]|uniref:Uncharacterized protein n=1 Tax=uncultured Dysgonomonas sp. TaxID=206096 RepID=A0A212K9G2_9BACT|nr:conserved exported hypothetical protein [uncultured Dysgonomonas sp.]
MNKKKEIASVISFILCILPSPIMFFFVVDGFAYVHKDLNTFFSILITLLVGFIGLYVTYLSLKYIIYFIIK